MNTAPAPLTVRPDFLEDERLAAVLDALPRARLVGGCVRDAVAALPVADIDLATPDPPEQVVAALAAAGLKSAPTGLKHGTVTAISGRRGFEVTTLRRDMATDGRHADVVWTDDWQVDAARRDFTINAMSMARDGALFDYFGGLADLSARRVRFVGDPAQRIAEDYLRLLRFFRFQARYGGAPPDPCTLAALRDGVPGLANLSAERVWSELKRILEIADPIATMRLMASLGVLAAVLPEMKAFDRFERLVRDGGPAEAMLRLAALAPGASERTAERLRLSGAERARLDALAGPAPDPGLEGAALRRALAETPAQDLIGRSWLADGAAGAGVRARLAATPRPMFPLAGRDAVAAGIAPGPAVGQALQQVRAWWLAGGCVAGPAECRAELAALASPGAN